MLGGGGGWACFGDEFVDLLLHGHAYILNILPKDLKQKNRIQHDLEFHAMTHLLDHLSHSRIT